MGCSSSSIKIDNDYNHSFELIKKLCFAIRRFDYYEVETIIQFEKVSVLTTLPNIKMNALQTACQIKNKRILALVLESDEIRRSDFECCETIFKQFRSTYFIDDYTFEGLMTVISIYKSIKYDL